MPDIAKVSKGITMHQVGNSGSMNTRISHWLTMLAVSGMSCMLGLSTIPKFAQISRDMIPPENLPVMTRLVLSAGPTGLTILALAAPALLVLTDRLPRTRRFYGIVVVLASAAIGFVVVALFLPLMEIMRSFEH